jgi:hypothetical protein
MLCLVYTGPNSSSFESLLHEYIVIDVSKFSGMGVSKRELQHVFDKYGPLREIWVARSPPCFAFVVFREKDDAEDAVKATDGM